MSTYCKNCGHRLAPNADTCYHCGAKFDDTMKGKTTVNASLRFRLVAVALIILMTVISLLMVM